MVLFSSNFSWLLIYEKYFKNLINSAKVFGPTLFDTWIHIFILSSTLVYVLLGTFYLDHRMILIHGRLLFFSIIVKNSYSFIYYQN